MKIVLLSDVEKLGSTGEVVTVKDGYARNYLIPIGYALKADTRNVRMLKAQQQVAEAKVLRELKTHKAMQLRLAKTELTTKVKTGEEDKMFGAVTSVDIAKMLAEKGIEIDRRIIDLPEPIKALGIYNVRVRLHANVIAMVKVRVEKEE
jgi:large subunit ribosomal protein L9